MFFTGVDVSRYGNTTARKAGLGIYVAVESECEVVPDEASVCVLTASLPRSLSSINLLSFQSSFPS